MTWTSPLLALPGAVEADGPDTGVAAHYGDPFREQKALLTGEGFVDLSHRGVIRVQGTDRLTWLHSLTTQYLLDLEPQQVVTTLVLSPQGHVEHAMTGYDDGDSFWAHVEPGAAPALVAWLDSMRFMMRVEVTDTTDEWAALATGPTTVTLVRRTELQSKAQGQPCGVWAFEALRIARGEPRMSMDTDHRTIPNEAGWIGPAVHLDKGCYRGQETVARVHHLGRPPRALRLLHLDGITSDQLPPQGTPITQAGRSIGFIGTAVRHFEQGPIALGVLKRKISGDAPLVAADSTVAVESTDDDD